MIKAQPKISIITVVFNGEDLIEGTIRSVINQTYPNIEYVVVDGASKDATLERIQPFKNQIDIFISEPDKGLYDAMNKSMQLATGDFIWFLNCGDHLFANDTVAKMVSHYTEETDVFYGEVMLVDEKRNHVGTRSELSTQKLPDQLTWKSLKRGMVVCHQGFVPRRQLAPAYIENNLSADIEWVIQILKKSRKTTHTNIILAEYLMGGISKKRHKQSLNDRYAILQKHFGRVPNLFNHGMIVLRGFVFKVMRFGKTKY